MTEPRGHAVGGRPTAPISPWIFYNDSDPATGIMWVYFQVTFGADNILTGGTTFRGANCPFSKVYLGALDVNGAPTAGAFSVPIPLGTRTHSGTQMAAFGLSTVADVLALPQITADL
jgi:hypothetical protein